MDGRGPRTPDHDTSHTAATAPSAFTSQGASATATHHSSMAGANFYSSNAIEGSAGSTSPGGMNNTPFFSGSGMIGGTTSSATGGAGGSISLVAGGGGNTSNLSSPGGGGLYHTNSYNSQFGGGTGGTSPGGGSSSSTFNQMAAANQGSATQVVVEGPPVLHLQLRPPAPNMHVTWDDSVIDNEGMGKKSSKKC
ncbi:unnamed protein product [Amoebophrya sp. A25]|nr:unnamed protein product [Amoebophrya sp. A25]|eukprot:GSA25T00020092001.1